MSPGIVLIVIGALCFLVGLFFRSNPRVSFRVFSFVGLVFVVLGLMAILGLLRGTKYNNLSIETTRGVAHQSQSPEPRI